MTCFRVLGKVAGVLPGIGGMGGTVLGVLQGIEQSRGFADAQDQLRSQCLAQVMFKPRKPSPVEQLEQQVNRVSEDSWIIAGGGQTLNEFRIEP